MEITSRLHGTLGIGRIPGRKRAALYRLHGASFYPIAYIDNDEDFEWLETFLLSMAEHAGVVEYADAPTKERHANA